MCAGIKVMVVLPACIADNYSTSKRKTVLESLGMICLSWGFHPVVPKEFAAVSKSCLKMLFQGMKSSLYLDLDDEIIELSTTPPTVRTRSSMRGVAHEVAAIYDKAVNFKEFSLTETNESAADAFPGQHWHRYAPTRSPYLWTMAYRTKPTMVKPSLLNEGIRPINNVWLMRTNHPWFYLVSR